MFTSSEQFMQVLTESQPSENAICTEDNRISWPQFLAILSCLCRELNYELVFGSPDDMHCAILAQEPLSADQLPLLPEGEDEPHRSR